MAKRFSCEPHRKSAYSDDLRWRMVWQRKVQELKLEKIAENLCIDTSTVQRICSKFDTTGQVSKKKYTSQNLMLKLSKPVQLTILRLVLEKRDIYLWEIQRELKFLYNLDVCISSICKLLKKSNFSRKKLQLIASQRDVELRMQYASDVSLYRQHNLIFVDETGCDRRDAIRKYGYGLRGKPAKCQKLLVRGERISVIAAMTSTGVLGTKVVRGGVSGTDFIDFININLLPHLKKFDGINPNSVIILDNCSIHHVSGAKHCMTQIGSLVHFLPPYSPDYNPIEFMFSKVKGTLRSMERELSATDDIETAVLVAFSSITGEDCKAWIDGTNLYIR